MFKDSGTFDLVIDIFENLIPTIFSNIIDLFQKYKNILKFIILLIFTIRIIYRIYVLEIKEEKVNLHYKLASSVFNLLIVKYVIIKELIDKNDKKNKNDRKLN